MRYGTTDVLHDVTLQARPGDVLALLGPNGAGKTTTIEILEGFRRRSAGHVQVLGIDPGSGDERWRARIGIVLQSWRDHARWRVRELLAHQGSYYIPYSTTAIHRPWDVDELLSAVGLSTHANQRIMTLSGGQRRRLDAAMGLVGRPELLFLDEPTGGLDPLARREFHRLVRQLADGLDTTILLATHDLEEAESLADRIIILDRGRIIGSGTADELSRQIAGEDMVRWTYNGQRCTESTSDSTTFARKLFAQYGEAITELDIRRASLEDTYLALVQKSEAGHGDPETIEQKS
jgi:ABC-2 type transport system ATP-binding protein